MSESNPRLPILYPDGLYVSSDSTMKYAFKKAVKTHPPPSLDYQLELNWSDLSTNLDYCIHLPVPCQLASSYLNFNCFFSSVYLALSSVSPPPLPSTGHTHVLRTPTVVTPFSTPYSTYLLPPLSHSLSSRSRCEAWEEGEERLRDNINWTRVTDVDCEMDGLHTSRQRPSWMPGYTSIQDMGQRTKRTEIQTETSATELSR